LNFRFWPPADGLACRPVLNPLPPLATSADLGAPIWALSPQQPQQARGTEFRLESLGQRLEVPDIVARKAEFSNCWQTLFEDLVWSMFRAGTILRALASLH
jgi:hypothetical protein